MVKSIVDQLLKYGKVERGIIGVLVQDMTPDLAEVFHSSAESKGALISQIIPGSPANKAGLKSGDIICKIGENSIESSGELRYLTGLLKIGETTDLTYLRYGKSYTIRISAAKLDAEKQMVTPYHKIDGIVMVDISELSPAYGYIQGIKVVNVDVYSQAIIAGLLPGDIIVSANNREMRSIKDLVEVVSNIGNRPLVLKVLRSASSMFVVIK
jgi:S1-C subfamily serine protease